MYQMLYQPQVIRLPVKHSLHSFADAAYINVPFIWSQYDIFYGVEIIVFIHYSSTHGCVVRGTLNKTDYFFSYTSI